MQGVAVGCVKPSLMLTQSRPAGVNCRFLSFRTVFQYNVLSLTVYRWYSVAHLSFWTSFLSYGCRCLVVYRRPGHIGCTIAFIYLSFLFQIHFRNVGLCEREFFKSSGWFAILLPADVWCERIHSGPAILFWHNEYLCAAFSWDSFRSLVRARFSWCWAGCVLWKCERRQRV